MKQSVPLQKLIQERFSCIIRNSMRKISEMQNIQKDREAWFWTVYITIFCQSRYSMYHTFFDLLFSTDEGRRWQRFVRLQPCCMRCWRQLYLLGKLMLRFDLYNFVIMSGILLITYFWVETTEHIMFNWFCHYRHKAMLKMLRWKGNSMNTITFFHCMHLGLNHQLWNLLRLLKCSLCNLG